MARVGWTSKDPWEEKSRHLTNGPRTDFLRVSTAHPQSLVSKTNNPTQKSPCVAGKEYRRMVRGRSEADKLWLACVWVTINGLPQTSLYFLIWKTGIQGPNPALWNSVNPVSDTPDLA